MKKINKILVVYGTRPEAIKMAPLYLELKKNSDLFETKICVTGQHRSMLDQVNDLFQIVPDFDLDIMKNNQDLNDITSAIILGMRDVFRKFTPDIVLVHGDTSTSFSASLAAFYAKITVGHIEAGLRTFNKNSPWPEEVNRQLTARIANIHFSPTYVSKQNLLKENIDDKSIFITGNTVIDSLLTITNKIKNDIELSKLLKEFLIKSLGRDIFVEKRRIVLITGHRRENFGNGFENICKAISSLANKYPNVDFIYPVHLNPNVQKPVNKILGHLNTNNIHLINPLDYLPFVYLMEKSTIILTDSGGIQEEAPSLNKPVLVMRDTTERPEALDAKTVKLVGTDFNTIVNEVSLLLENEFEYNSMSSRTNPYGDGHASEKIVEVLSRFEY